MATAKIKDVLENRGEIFNYYLKIYRTVFRYMRYIDIKKIVPKTTIDNIKSCINTVDIVLPDNDYQNLFGDNSEKNEMKLISMAIFILSNESKYKNDKVLDAYALINMLNNIIQTTTFLDLYKIRKTDNLKVQHIIDLFIKRTSIELSDLNRRYLEVVKETIGYSQWCRLKGVIGIIDADDETVKKLYGSNVEVIDDKN